jgi:phage terminase large subunit GpA-like protein
MVEHAQTTTISEWETTKAEADEIARRAEREAFARRTFAFFGRLARTTLRPPPKLSIAQWADAYRRLSRESSAEPGQWLTDKAPFQREPMNAIGDNETRQVVLKWCSQAGKTEVGVLNPLAFFIDRDPCPILIVMPTLRDADGLSTERIAPMIRDTPVLRSKIAEPRSRDSGNTTTKKMFAGGFVAIEGANSPSGLSGRPIRVVLFNEVDRYPLSAGSEGDPVSMALKRATTFWNRKTILNSSPTILGASRISTAFENSTQEYWYLKCPSPGCAHVQTLRWDQLRFEDARLRCEKCENFFGQVEWQAQPGTWVAHAEHASARGFHLNALASPWVAWEDLIVEFKEASALAEQGDYEQLKVFINTRLAEDWEVRGDRIEHDLYRERREVYNAELPDGVLLLTCGVDVQQNRLMYEVVGWGAGRESWGVEYGFITGDPHEADVWHLLDERVLDRVWQYGDGAKTRIKRICVDSGYLATESVYKYCKPRQPRVFAIKGLAGLGLPLIKSFGTRGKERVTLFVLGVDTGKDEITSRLRVERAGPGYCHFPRAIDGGDLNGYDENFFKGLTSERRITKFVNGFRKYQWIKRSSDENEPFDCRNYALAALAISGVDLNRTSRDATVEGGRGVVTLRRFGAQSALVTPVGGGRTESTSEVPGARRFGVQNRPVSW